MEHRIPKNSEISFLNTDPLTFNSTFKPQISKTILKHKYSISLKTSYLDMNSQIPQIRNLEDRNPKTPHMLNLDSKNLRTKLGAKPLKAFRYLLH